MKKLAYTALVVLIMASCKKQGAPMPKEKLLAKIYENNDLSWEFTYNTDKKLKNVKRFEGGFAGPIIDETYEYDANGFLKEKIRIYNSTPSKFLFQCNGAGQVIKMTEIDMTGADSGTVQAWIGYTYNVQNRLIRIDYYQANDNLAGYEELGYATNGVLVSIDVYKQWPAGPDLIQQWQFKGASGRVGSGMQKAFIEPDRKEFMYLDAKSFKVTSVSGGIVQGITQIEMTDRQLESAGLYSQQTVTLKHTFPIASAPIVKNMRYEYVEK